MAIKNVTLADMSTEQMVLKEDPVVRQALDAAAAPIAPATPATAKITRHTYIELQNTPPAGADIVSDAEVSIAVLAALDCIIVDQYKEDFSLFATQEQKAVSNPNIEDIEVMTRENSTTIPSNQFPSVDSTFYELDAGYSVAQEKVAIAAAIAATQDHSTIVSDLILQNMTADSSNTLKQLSSLNTLSGTSSNTKVPTAKAIPVVNTTKTATQPITSDTPRSYSSTRLKY